MKIRRLLRAAADRVPRFGVSKRSLVAAIITYRFITCIKSKNTMSEAKFNKAVAIVQSLPKNGPIQPSQDDQLFVRTPVFFRDPNPYLTAANLQFYGYYKQGVCCKAQSRVHLGTSLHFPGPFESSPCRRHQHRETHGLHGFCW